MSTKQPNSRLCFVCGVDNPVGLHLNFYETSPGEIRAEFTAPSHFQGYPGVMHGGIVASILDETSGRSHMGNATTPRFMFTGKLEVRYRKNVPIEKPLVIVGRAGKLHGKMAESWAGIYDENGDLLAEAKALHINVPEEAIDLSRLNELGWKVYPD